jgi:hypothetical protein
MRFDWILTKPTRIEIYWKIIIYKFIIINIYPIMTHTPFEINLCL